MLLALILTFIYLLYGLPALMAPEGSFLCAHARYSSFAKRSVFPNASAPAAFHQYKGYSSAL
ncbi:hypothetical protein E6C60_0024 [Paenibacillus algicola]|uniref:Uncharacterized protein n=1 Tax=Paenibacillus algicola TaxID=2565926 RepID=A0A4P8XEJ9_9BACL|nr:hypothetical protein E6C60_0024 [Paenibacillus algicola]